jgi:predicted DsbA family dithiol-disulfide isomerase
MHDATRPELKVTVFSDYICPFCYVGDARLSRLREYYDLKVNWCLLEIHPETSSRGESFETLTYAPDTWQRMMSTLGEMAEQDGLSFRNYSFTTNSGAALQLAEAAKFIDASLFYRLHAGLFEAFFARGENIGDRGFLHELAAGLGMRPADIESAWSDKAVERRLRQYLMAAGELGVAATPTFFIGDRRIQGAVPFAQLREAAGAAAS